MTIENAASTLSSLRDLRFGVEVEVVGATRAVIAKAVAKALGVPQRNIVAERSYDRRVITGRDGRKWSVCSDASLSGGAYSGEIVTPILTYADLPVLQAIVAQVAAPVDAGGAGARVDSSCGIHIHVDGAHFDGRKVANLIKTVHKQERLIVAALAILPNRYRYCADIPSSLIAKLEQENPVSREDMARIWYGSEFIPREHYHHSRYHGVNIHSLFYRGTVEFRWFNSTLNPGQVKAYVQFVLALAFRGLTVQSAVAKRRDVRDDNTKFMFRGFLKNLGLVGDEFKTCRQHLLEPLAGPATHRIRD